MQEETKMDKLTTEFAEYICDHLCKHPTFLSKEKLEDKCLECKIGQFICDILNEYNRINNFDKLQSTKLLKQIQELKERDIAKRPILEGDGYDPEGNLVLDEWICPNCNTRYEADYDDYDFCPNCGQKLDWSERNE